jgi:hypothetical protein
MQAVRGPSRICDAAHCSTNDIALEVEALLTDARVSAMVIESFDDTSRRLPAGILLCNAPDARSIYHAVLAPTPGACRLRSMVRVSATG